MKTKVDKERKFFKVPRLVPVSDSSNFAGVFFVLSLSALMC